MSGHRKPVRSDLVRRVSKAKLVITAVIVECRTQARCDTADDSGSVTLRVNGRLHHIGISRTLARTPVILLIQDLHVRVVAATTGELLRELTINPNKNYQPTGTKRNSRTRATQVQEFPMS